MKKRMVIVCVAAMTLSLVGCGSKAATEDATVVSEQAVSEEAVSTEVETTESTQEETTVQSEKTLGKVTAVDGDTITIALGEMEAAQAPSGEKPEGEAPSGEKPEGEAPSGEKPEGEAPNGEEASGDNKGIPFKESGETITISLDGTVVVMVQNGKDVTEGTNDDVKEGSLISITYNDSGNVTTIQVLGAGEKEASSPESAEETSATEE